MAAQFRYPIDSLLSGTSVPLSAGKLYFYESNTTTPLDTYSNDTLTTPNANPVVLNSEGRHGPIYLKAQDYKVILKNALGVQVGATIDPVHGGANSLLITATGATLARPLSDYFADEYNALNFGALGDGTGNSGTDVDYTTQLQAAMDAAWAADRNLFIPAGVYKTTGLVLPGNAAGRTKAFRMYGQGSGEIFARGYTGGTILYSATDAPILLYTPDVANTGGGNIEIDHIRFEGNSTTPVVHLKSFYAQSNFHHNTIFQDGVGDGLKIELSNTIEIHNNYAINRDWNTLSLGAARTGAGFRIFQTIATGLTSLRKNTSRGFLDAYVIGDGSVAMYSTELQDNECSVVRNGFTIMAGADKALLLHNYMEGGDGGRAMLIQGNFCTMRDNLVFSGFAKAIDDVSIVNYGSLGTGNILSVGSVAGTTLIDVSDIGFGKRYTGNTLVFPGSGGSITNVIAIHLAGADANINYAGNFYNPVGAWTGGSGTARIADATTVSGGVSGTSPGVIGDLATGQPTVWYTGDLTPAAAATGTDTTPVVTESYFAEVFVAVNATLTGIAILNGSAVAGNVKASLVDSGGLQAATTASTALSGTAAFQKIAFTAQYAVKGPGKYLIHLQFNNTGARFRSHAVGVFGAAKKTGETYGTFTTITVPSTFTADLGPIAAVY